MPQDRNLKLRTANLFDLCVFMRLIEIGGGGGGGVGIHLESTMFELIKQNGLKECTKRTYTPTKHSSNAENAEDIAQASILINIF